MMTSLMNLRFARIRGARWLCLALLAAFSAAAGPSQQTSGTLRGQVSDPSGAVVVGARIVVTNTAGSSIDTESGKDGTYEFRNLVPGRYAVKAVAQGFNLFVQENVEVSAGQIQRVNIPLSIEVREEKVEVSDSSNQVTVDPTSNAAAVVLRGKDLDQLSDDPDELESELQALAGPSAGPNGGQMYIDGFTAGQLPPKASIREIRLNQNPFSSEYDKLGYGRIEIFTKPGTEQFHGQLFVSGTTAAFNARNPFEALPSGVNPPGYNTTQYSGNVGGPLGKRASFFFNAEARRVNDLHIVSTPVVDLRSFAIVPFSDSVPNPGRRLNLSPRLDLQLTPRNTLAARYQYFRDTDENEGVGQFSLTENGYRNFESEQTVQLSDTQVLGAAVINETRFQFVRERNNLTPNSFSPTLDVQGAFSAGENSQGLAKDILDRYEIQNYTSATHGKHFLKFGIRLRDFRDSNFANPNFNGAFLFGSRQNPVPGSCPPGVVGPCDVLTGLEAYQLTVQGLANGQSIASVIAAGGGASQYSITIPAPGVSPNAVFTLNYFDLGPYVQDDFRIRPNVTLSFGLRYEVQNHSSDHSDFAPRLGLAWGIGGNAKNPPKTVFRAGFGIFYDRFAYDSILQQQRLSGSFTQQIVVQSPGFFLPNVPDPAVLQSSPLATPTVYAGNPSLRSPYTIQTGVTVERQVTKAGNVAVTYLTSRGVHQFFTENINPPICNSLPCDAQTALRASGPNNIYQYQSEGIFKQSQFIVNSSLRLRVLSLFGYYVVNNAHGDTSGVSSFPSLDNNISLDYGRTRFDIHQRLFAGGTITLPKNFRLNPFVIASSGIPYTISTGQDLNGDSVFNDRPTFASASSNPASVVTNRHGSFNLVPQPGEAFVPINSLTSDGRFTMNLRVSKTFGFGRKREAVNRGGPGMATGTFGRGPGGPGGGGGHGSGFHGGAGMDGNNTGQRFSLTLAVSARNIFNNVNLSTPVGNLSSPLFGRANGLAGQPYSSSTANRRIDLQATFTF
jgi:hypothetical protein